MREISNFEVYVLAAELNSLAGLYLEKFYEIEKNSFRIRIEGRGEKRNLSILLPHCINQTDTIVKSETPTNFAIAMRKRVSGLQIERVEQLNSDRIIAMHIARREEKFSVIVELFGKGNLILLDGFGKIALTYMQHDFKDRSVRVGRQYRPPASQQQSEGEEGKSRLIQYLSKRHNFGNIYIEDAILREGLDPKQNADTVERGKMEEVERRIKGIPTAKREPEVYLGAEGKAVNYSLFPLARYCQSRAEKAGSLQAALERFYKDNRAEEGATNNAHGRHAAELKSSMERQMELIKEAAQEAENDKKAGAFIFSKMNEFNHMISTMRERKRMTVEELQQLFPKLKIIEINQRDKRIAVEI